MKLKHPIILLTAVMLAAVSGWFSVNGMASVYAGDGVAVIAIFVAIELGKLANAAFLHANWRRLGLPLKAGLSLLLLAIMALTSAGVYGKLTHAFLAGEPERVAATQQVSLLRANVADLDRQIEVLDKVTRSLAAPETVGIIKTVAAAGKPKLAANMMNTIMSGERADAKARSGQRAELVRTRQTAGVELAAAEVKLASHEVELGPALSLASLGGLEPSQAIKALTLIATLCLDPLAVLLVMAASGPGKERKPARPKPTTRRRRRKTARKIKSAPRKATGDNIIAFGR
jgi:hypothetical protein